jgi:hypothetical protein
MNVSAIVTLGGVQVPMLEGRIQPTVILVDMMIVVALAAWARARPRLRVQRRSWMRSTSFFWMNCRHLTWRTGHYAWPCCSFSWSICACNHPSCCRTWSFLSPCCHVEGNHGVDCLDANCQVGDCCNCVGRFNNSCVVVVVTTAMLAVAWFMAMHGRIMSCFLLLWLLLPWWSYQECQLPCWLLDTAQRRQSFWAGRKAPSYSSQRTCSGAP